ncbi:MAG: nucleoside hydrolase [Candidatus Bipolaricaulia bacterium]
MSVKVLLDTDIGSDIDDAVCLAYLLAQPECDLLGITTVTGEPEKRAMLASAICRVAGKEIPIFPGAPQPLLVSSRQPQVPQAAALENWEYATEFPQGRALGFMRETIYDNPGEVVLLAIGPMTNVALLFRMDARIPELLKSLVLMCGVFVRSAGRRNLLEWNALVDPHAAAIVYQTDVNVHRSVGLDVTTQVVMDTEEVRAHFSVDLLQPVLDFAEVWFEQRDEITFHDPLAAAVIFDDGICTFKRGEVQVELASAPLQGMTLWNSRVSDPKHEIALEVDSERFFEHFFSVFQ